MTVGIRTPRPHMKQGTQTREKENKTRTGVTGLCHKTMNKLEQSNRILTLSAYFCVQTKSWKTILESMLCFYMCFFLKLWNSFDWGVISQICLQLNSVYCLWCVTSGSKCRLRSSRVHRRLLPVRCPSWSFQYVSYHALVYHISYATGACYCRVFTYFIKLS